MTKYFVCLIFFVLLTSSLFSQNNRILIDEDFSDWDGISESYSDPSGDQTTGNIDFGKLWISNDEQFLFLSIEVGDEINIQDGNDITIYIDSDNNDSSGFTVGGIGAEIEFNFGGKWGKFRLNNITYPITQNHIGLVTSPTVTSDRFEIAINYMSQFGGVKLFNSDTIRILLKDNGDGKDVLPDIYGGVEFVFNGNHLVGLPAYSIKKADDNYLRIMSYNVHRDDIFESYLYDNYSRIFNAIEPDIIGFQEIYNHSSQETADLIETIIPLDSNRIWYNEKIDDLIVVSKFPIKWATGIEGLYGNRANFAVLIDIRQKYESDLLLINAHPPCCDNNENRQNEFDMMMAFVRDLKNGTGQFVIEQNTPIIIVGDMNLVGYYQQQKTLLTGDIYDNENYGRDFDPDWDSTALEDTKPFSTDLPLTFTWYSENSTYCPGRLDYIVSTNSVLEEKNSYVLFTKYMNPDTLNEYGLLPEDVVEASDHLPLVADFVFKNITDIDKKPDEMLLNQFNLYQNFPNPFNPATNIIYTISERSYVELKVFDFLGIEVGSMVNEIKVPGEYKIEFDGNMLPSGVYFYRLKIHPAEDVIENGSGIFVSTKKMILLK
ncbi:endonuclease/exonuclease/phosphatase family protein [Bacteroidota bacterium]